MGVEVVQQHLDRAWQQHVRVHAQDNLAGRLAEDQISRCRNAEE
jgi:hypothetical protein